MFLIATISLLIWVYLCLFHGEYWQLNQILNNKEVNFDNVPKVVAVVPARDEAECIGRTVTSLMAQAYDGDVRIIVVDDNSTDGTSDIAREAATGTASKIDLQIIDGAPLADGWVGKMWAVHQGIEAAGDADYILLTDADIEHAPDNLSKLVDKAESQNLGLVSLMVKLRTESVWEKLLIPAFVYFFQKLYPFARVNDPQQKIAAAAGGCMLVHAETFAPPVELAKFAIASLMIVLWRG